jgi:hypothetical protein
LQCVGDGRTDLTILVPSVSSKWHIWKFLSDSLSHSLKCHLHSLLAGDCWVVLQLLLVSTVSSSSNVQACSHWRHCVSP